MKKVLLLMVVVVGTAFVASAQISKGSSYLGGNINYGHSDVKSDAIPVNYEQTVLGVSPSVAFAYKENRVWGLGLSYLYNKVVATRVKQNTYSVVAFLRQYKPLGKGFYLFAHEGVAGSYFTAENLNGIAYDYKGWGVNAGVSPGVAYDLSKKFQLELMMNNIAYVSYENSSATPVSGGVKNTYNSLNINTGLSQLGNVSSWAIGARYVFGR